MSAISILNRDDLRRAQAFYVTACRDSREHSRLAGEALRKYGDHGPNISGIVRDHFPQSVKEHLRVLAQRVTEACDRAQESRPKRVRSSTMRKLASAVARRDGAGFYGPQP